MGTVPWASSPLLPLWEGWFLWVRCPCGGGGGGIWGYGRALTSARVSAWKVSALGPGRGEEEGRGSLWPFCSGQLRLAGCLGGASWPDTVLKREMAAKHILIQGRLALTCIASGPKRPGCAFVASPDLLPRAGFEVLGIPGLTQVTHDDLTLEWALACQDNLPAGDAAVGCGESEGSLPVASVFASDILLFLCAAVC